MTNWVFDPQGVSDGAAAVIVASEDAVKEHKLTPLARIVSYHVSGCDPSIMGIGERISKMQLNQCGISIKGLLVLSKLVFLNAPRSRSCSHRSSQESWSDRERHGPRGGVWHTLCFNVSEFICHMGAAAVKSNRSNFSTVQVK